MTDKIVEAVALAIAVAEYAPADVWVGRHVVIQDKHRRQTVAAIDAYLKALKKEGKCVTSERNLQELVTNRKVYEG